MQPSRGFANDVIHFPYEKAGENLQTIKKIAEYEMQIMIGIFSVTSWPAFAAVDALDFVIKNKKKFPQWKNIINACLATRKDLKTYAPTLYDKLVYSTLLIAWKGTKYMGAEGDVSDSLAESALNNPNIAGRGAGIIAGKIGMQAMNGRLTVLSAIWAILFTLATKLAAAVPGAVSVAANSVKDSSGKEKADLAMDILALLRDTDVKVSKEEALIIVGEVMAHPKELKESLAKLAKAFTTTGDAK